MHGSFKLDLGDLLVEHAEIDGFGQFDRHIEDIFIILKGKCLKSVQQRALQDLSDMFLHIANDELFLLLSWAFLCHFVKFQCDFTQSIDLLIQAGDVVGLIEFFIPCQHKLSVGGYMDVSGLDLVV